MLKRYLIAAVVLLIILPVSAALAGIDFGKLVQDAAEKDFGFNEGNVDLHATMVITAWSRECLW